MTVRIDDTKCNGCGVCIQSCPVDVLRLDMTRSRAAVAYEQDCHVCCLCEDDCPTGAIDIDYAMASPRQKSIYDILNMTIIAPPED